MYRLGPSLASTTGRCQLAHACAFRASNLAKPPRRHSQSTLVLAYSHSHGRNNSRFSLLSSARFATSNDNDRSSSSNYNNNSGSRSGVKIIAAEITPTSSSIDAANSNTDTDAAGSDATAHVPPPATGASLENVYVHPLSQLILEYLQIEHHDWIVAHGLHRSLIIHRDGTFELKFMDDYFNDGTTASAVMDGTSEDEESEVAPQKRNGAKSIGTADSSKHRLWTCFDEAEKKHWLTVHRGESLHERFLLQDNLVPSWHGNRASLPERIHAAVNNLIRAVHNHSMAHRSLLRLNTTVSTASSAVNAASFKHTDDDNGNSNGKDV